MDPEYIFHPFSHYPQDTVEYNSFIYLFIYL